jgi:hypothetical protein
MCFFNNCLNLVSTATDHEVQLVYLHAMVGQVQESHHEDCLPQLSEGFFFGGGILKSTKVDDGNGGEISHLVWLYDDPGRVED